MNLALTNAFRSIPFSELKNEAVLQTDGTHPNVCRMSWKNREVIVKWSILRACANSQPKLDQTEIKAYSEILANSKRLDKPSVTNILCPHGLTSRAVVGFPITGLVFPKYASDLTNRLPLDNYSYEDKIALMQKMANGIKTLHNLGIVHGDVKPSNVLVNDDQLCRFVRSRHFKKAGNGPD
jgi:serine/threonine protein kinase